MSHAREREHPEYHDATRLALRRFRRLSGLCRRFVASHGWIPAFAGMTHAGLAGRDAAVVSRRRLSLSGPGATASAPAIADQWRQNRAAALLRVDRTECKVQGADHR